MGKKRRYDVDLESERTLYSTFVAAANSMSQLYSQAVQQQRKASAAASRQTLERVLGFLLKEYGSADTIPKAALLHFLQQEYENVDGSEQLPQQFPVHFLPTPSPTSHSMDDLPSPEPIVHSKPPLSRGSGHMLSPSTKRANSGSSNMINSSFTSCMAMDTADTHAHHVSPTMPVLAPSVVSADAKLFVHGTGFGAC